MMYHLRATLATTKRILQQLSHDKRSLALIFLVPVVLMSLLYWLHHNNLEIFNKTAPALLGLFPFIIMFIITSITTLRERTGGTLERILVTPVSKLDIILGYTIAFGLLAVIQALIASFVSIWLLGLDVAGAEWLIVLFALIDALLGTVLGLLVSAFAHTEFQAVQFMPALILPQLLVCGLLLPVSQMPDILQFIAYCLPLTYAVDAMQGIASQLTFTDDMWRDTLVIVCFIVASVLLGALTLRRKER